MWLDEADVPCKERDSEVFQPRIRPLFPRYCNLFERIANVKAIQLAGQWEGRILFIPPDSENPHLFSDRWLRILGLNGGSGVDSDLGGPARKNPGWAAIRPHNEKLL